MSNLMSLYNAFKAEKNLCTVGEPVFEEGGTSMSFSLKFEDHEFTVYPYSATDEEMIADFVLGDKALEGVIKKKDGKWIDLFLAMSVLIDYGEEEEEEEEDEIVEWEEDEEE